MAFSRDRDDNERIVPTTTISRGKFGDVSTEASRRDARARALGYLNQMRADGKTFKNDDTGWQIGFSRRGNNELKSWTADPTRLELLASLPGVLKNAVLANSETGREDSRINFHTLYAPVRLDGVDHVARVVVREDANGHFAYDLQNSRILDAKNPAESDDRVLPTPKVGAIETNAAGREFTVAQLRDLVNRTDRPGWKWENKAASGESAPATAAVASNQAPGEPLHPWTPVHTDVSVPYAGGVSDDGQRVYLDKRMPATVDVDGKTIDAHDAVALHERTEYPLMHLTGPMDGAAIDAVEQRMGAEGKLSAEVRSKLARGKSLSYAEAHDIATKTENAMVRDRYGVDPAKYQAALAESIANARREAPHASDIPPDLDAKPYRDAGEADLHPGDGSPAPRRDFSLEQPGEDKPDDSGETPEPGQRPKPFSRSAASIEMIHDQLPQLDRSAFEKAKDWLAGKAQDFEPKALGALNLRHVLELAGEDSTLKAHATRYADLYQKMDGDRNQMTVDGAAKVDALNKWARERGAAGWMGKLKPQAKALFRLMHDITQLGVDPTSQYERLLVRDDRGEQQPWTRDLISERIKTLRNQMRGRSGDDKTQMMDEVKALKALPARERLRQAKYPELVARWNALTPEAREQFMVMRDHYKAQSEALMEATIDRINGLDIPQQNKLAAIELVRKNFEDAQVGGVYFPLGRFGDYWISAHDKDGGYFFAKYESAAAQQDAEKRIIASGGQIEATGRQDRNYRSKDAPSGTFMGQLMETLRKGNAPDKVQDEIYQMYLQTLPDLSLRKNNIHRKNVAGYTDDVPRVFASNVFHGAHQISKARYGWQLQNTLERMRETVDARRYVLPAAKAAHADALMGELNRRHDWILNPTNSKLANMANSIAFGYYMAASPASALVNLIQVPQIVLPTLGARHGWGKASAVLSATMRDAFRTGGNIDRVLTGEELMAFKALQQQGTFQRTATHTLAGVAEGNALRSNPNYARVMNAVSWMFHKSEVINREGTGIAAYRLARAQGQTFEHAVKYADEITNGTHGDYSNANRARYMQGNVQKVLFQFKNYSLAMSWLWGRNFYKAFKGETPEVKAIARRTLTGIMGMTGLFAGVMGLPIYNALKYSGQAIHAVTGGDDQPFDFDTEFRSWLAEHLGSTAASIIADGAANQLGANVASRVSMSDLWFRDADKQLEGEDAYNNLLQSLAGPLGNVIKNMYVGAQEFNQGHTERGIETMMPAFAKNAMKAVRFATQGDNNLRGDPIVPDVSAPEQLMQLIGFQPTNVADQQRINSALENYQSFVKERRQAIINAFAMAQSNGDADGRADALKSIQAFNVKYPEIAIRPSTLVASMRTRNQRSAQAQNGIMLDKKLAGRIREDVGAMASQ